MRLMFRFFSAASLLLIFTDQALAGKHCCYKAGGSSGAGMVACNANPKTFWTNADCGNAPSGGGGGGGSSKHCCWKAGGSANQFGNVVACNANPLTLWTAAACGNAPPAAPKHCCLKAGGPSNINSMAICNANPKTFWTSAHCGYDNSSTHGYCCLKSGGGQPVGDFQTKNKCLSGALAFNREWVDKPCKGPVLAEAAGNMNPINAGCTAIQHSIEKQAEELKELKHHPTTVESFDREKKLCNHIKALIVAKGACTLTALTVSIVEAMHGGFMGLVGDVVLTSHEIQVYRNHHGGNWPHHRCKKS